ncbi:MAG: hypothetical protein DRJ49_04905, partial [Thermoprotei archaeon]
YSVTTSVSLALAYEILKRSEHFTGTRDLTRLIVEKANEKSSIMGEGAIKVVKNSNRSIQFRHFLEMWL